MSRARRRPSRKRPSRRARWVAAFDRAGRSVVLAAWWLVAWTVRMLAIGCEQATAAGARWLRAQSVRTRVALASAAVVALVIAWRWHRASDDRTVDEVEALARVIRSEVGNSPPEHRLHVAWATRNLALERGQSIAEMACSPCGPQDRSRPVSSRQRATDADRALAREVLAADCTSDPTGGASHFINPVLQDRLARIGAPGYAGNTYRVVARRWRVRYGWAPYYRLGPTLELWGPASREHGARRHAGCFAR